ncbi:hypothetical protein K402DRAFT_299586, partial [Aulographum hederae CBS 113979]
RIYVGNLMYAARREDVEEVFGREGFDVQHITISTDPFTARNPSYCFVSLPSSSEAQRALDSLPGTIVLGRPIKVKPCTPDRKTHPGNPEHSYSKRWQRPDRDVEASVGFNKERSADGRRLFVGGLPRPASQMLSEIGIREVFAAFKIKTFSPRPGKADQPGNHHYAFVDFATDEEAERAREALNGKIQFGGRLKVA